MIVLSNIQFTNLIQLWNGNQQSILKTFFDIETASSMFKACSTSAILRPKCYATWIFWTNPLFIEGHYNLKAIRNKKTLSASACCQNYRSIYVPASLCHLTIPTLAIAVNLSSWEAVFTHNMQISDFEITGLKLLVVICVTPFWPTNHDLCIACKGKNTGVSSGPFPLHLFSSLGHFPSPKSD